MSLRAHLFNLELPSQQLGWAGLPPWELGEGR